MRAAGHHKLFKKHSLRSNRIGYLFIMPSLVFIAVFIFGMIVYSVCLSFFDWDIFTIGKDKVFVGLSNYKELFSDKVFGTSIINTLLLTYICIFVEIVLGFIISYALWKLERGKKFIQSLILLPMITAPIVVGLIWKYIYDPQFGILNYLINLVYNAGRIGWLGNYKTSLPSLMVVEIWQMTPFVILVLLAGLTSISNEIVEAANVDGVNNLQTAFYIVIPIVKPLFVLVLLIRSMDLFKIFDVIYVLTKGGPGYATETMAMYIYKTGFSFYRMGYSMALSFFVLIFVLILSSYYFKTITINKK